MMDLHIFVEFDFVMCRHALSGYCAYCDSENGGAFKDAVRFSVHAMYDIWRAQHVHGVSVHVVPAGSPGAANAVAAKVVTTAATTAFLILWVSP